jgi:hypothetical protein
MIKGVSMVLVAGGLLAGMVMPQVARAHGSDELVAFVAGTAVGYLLNADRDVHHVHHYGPVTPAYVVQHHHYAPRQCEWCVTTTGHPIAPGMITSITTSTTASTAGAGVTATDLVPDADPLRYRIPRSCTAGDR